MPVKFNEKLEIAYEMDEDGNVKVDNNNNPVTRKKHTVDWSIQKLKDLFYTKKLLCLVDYKLDTQINGVFSKKSVT